MFKIFFIQSIVLFFANCLQKNISMIIKVSCWFALNNANGLGKVHIVLLCSTPLVTGIIQFVDIWILKTTLKNFKEAKCRNPCTLKRIIRRHYGIIQNLKKGKAKWHKNCALKLSASKHSNKKRKDSFRFLWLCSK